MWLYGAAILTALLGTQQQAPVLPEMPELSADIPLHQSEVYSWEQNETFELKKTFERFSFFHDIGDKNLQFLSMRRLCATDAQTCTIRVRVRFMVKQREQGPEDVARGRAVHDRALHYAIGSDSGVIVHAFSVDSIDSTATPHYRGASQSFRHWLREDAGYKEVDNPGLLYDCLTQFIAQDLFVMIREEWLAREAERP